MNSQSYYNPNVTLPTVLCCVCGLPINPNSANMCVPCLRSKIDISEGFVFKGINFILR
jgi:nonsense-mediated mRNA decay protein 3